MMDYPTNIVLLLLQIVLAEQEQLAHQIKNASLEDLLKDPVVDSKVLSQFTQHQLVKLYAPELAHMSLRGLKSVVRDVFDKGIPKEFIEKTQESDENNDFSSVTVVTLANYYYSKRISELQDGQLPELKKQIQEAFKELT